MHQSIYRYLYLALIFTIAGATCLAQGPAFAPLTFNYSTHNYNAGNQNWAIAQGRDKVIYFGNEHGLLTFDAVNWKLHRLPNNLSVKSILADYASDKERIYVGSFEEFGYFQKNDKNELSYHSLKQLITDHKLHNDEVWTINKIGREIFFQTFSSYFIYDEVSNSLRTVKPYPAPLFFFSLHDKLYAQFIDDSFYILDGKNFRPLLARDKLNDDNIVSILPFDNEMLLFTSSNGIYTYNPETAALHRKTTAIDEVLKHETVNRVVALSDSTFALGTLNNGIYALRSDGKLLWKLNRNNGLHNNTILGMFVDKERNLWAALDNGIACIQTNSNISIFEPQQNRIGMTEDILVKDGQFYLATNQGIYHYSEKEGKLDQLPGFNVQSWFIRNFDGQTITGNNAGTAFIEQGKKTDIPQTSTGGTDIRAMRIHEKEFLLESTYTAFQIYSKNQQNKWMFSHKVDNFFDLISQIEYDHAGNIWASHMYKGIYKIRLDEQLQQVVQQDFYTVLDSARLPTMPMRTMKLRGRIVISDGNSFFTYDDIAQKIIPYDQLNQQLQSLADTWKIIAVNDSTFWFLRTDEYTLVRTSSGKHQIIDRIPFAILNNPPNTRRGNIFVDESGISYFCLNGGVGRYKPMNIEQNTFSGLEISRIWSYDRKTDTPSNLGVKQKNIVNYSENNISVQFQYPDFSKRKFTVECFLENYDTRWISTSADLTISYPNLPAGNYKLRARVAGIAESNIPELSISFKIKNPWYITVWAISVYTLILALLFYFSIRTYIRMAVNKRNRIFELKEKERISQLNHQEKVIAEMKNEKLEDDLTHKSKELANASMLIINHEELLNKLKTEIQEQVRKGQLNRFHGTSLVNMINSNLSGEDEWLIFQDNFDLIHENFFRKLSEQYTELTPSDLRLCALLRLNYSSKEIAKMLNLTLRGVESARYRLRKKLQLDESENLTSFIINFK